MWVKQFNCAPFECMQSNPKQCHPKFQEIDKKKVEYTQISSH